MNAYECMPWSLLSPQLLFFHKYVTSFINRATRYACRIGSGTIEASIMELTCQKSIWANSIRALFLMRSKWRWAGRSFMQGFPNHVKKSDGSKATFNAQFDLTVEAIHYRPCFQIKNENRRKGLKEEQNALLKEPARKINPEQKKHIIMKW